MLKETCVCVSVYTIDRRSNGKFIRQNFSLLMSIKCEYVGISNEKKYNMGAQKGI